MRKIIHFADATAYDPNIPDFESRHYGGWATNFARKTLEYTDKYEIEDWKIYNPKHYGNYGISVREKYGITFKLFPATKIGSRYFSIPLHKEIIKRIKDKEKILVHLQTAHKIWAYLIILQCKKIPIVYTPRSGAPPIEKFKLNKNPLYLPMQLIDLIALKYIDFVFAGSIGELNYLKKVGFYNTRLERTTGIDLGNCKILDKNEIRKELRLPLDKKILVFIGRYIKWKGADTVVEAYKKLKRIFDIEMIFIGGNESHPFYDDIIESGAIEVGYIPRDSEVSKSGPTVVKYLNAADVFIYPVFLKDIILFSGLGATPTMAMAMNVPVVSTNLINFHGTIEERKRLGLIPTSKEDVVRCVAEIFEHPERFKGAREIAKKYFTWERVLKKNCEVYDKLFQKYYGI